MRAGLPRLLDRLDGGGRVLGERPGVEREGTRFPRTGWDLRTLICVLPPGEPLRFLNVNTVLGQTGTPFDQARAGRVSPRDTFDFQLCLEGADHGVTVKELIPAAGAVTSREGALDIVWGERLRYSGAWPDYALCYRGPDGIELDVALSTRPGVQWWAHAGDVYTHYTTFGACRVGWRMGGESGVVSGIGLHDHGYGMRSRVPVPLRVFRYEVLWLSDGSCAVALWTEGPLGLTLRNTGVLLPESGLPSTLPQTSCEALAPEPFVNHAGERRYVPSRWRGRLAGHPGTLDYEARRTTQPQAVLGDGFLHAFSFESVGTGAFADVTGGVGYVEQIGRAFARPFGRLKTEPPPP